MVRWLLATVVVLACVLSCFAVSSKRITCMFCIVTQMGFLQPAVQDISQKAHILTCTSAPHIQVAALSNGLKCLVCLDSPVNNIQALPVAKTCIMIMVIKDSSQHAVRPLQCIID